MLQTQEMGLAQMGMLVDIHVGLVNFFPALCGSINIHKNVYVYNIQGWHGELKLKLTFQVYFIC